LKDNRVDDPFALGECEAHADAKENANGPGYQLAWQKRELRGDERCQSGCSTGGDDARPGAQIKWRQFDGDGS
jgi:hypothetical protein